MKARFTRKAWRALLALGAGIIVLIASAALFLTRLFTEAPGGNCRPAPPRFMKPATTLPSCRRFTS